VGSAAADVVALRDTRAKHRVPITSAAAAAAAASPRAHRSRVSHETRETLARGF